MITHDERIADMADRLVRIKDGRIVYNETKIKKKVDELGL